MLFLNTACIMMLFNEEKQSVFPYPPDVRKGKDDLRPTPSLAMESD